MFYCEIAVGAPNNRGIIIRHDELKGKVAQAQAADVPLYRSVYLYDEELLDYFKLRKSVRLFKGMRYIDRLILDIDKSGNTDDFTLERARQFVQKLEDDWKLDRQHINIWYSGNGYHIAVPDIFHFDAGRNLHEEVKLTVEKYFPEADSLIFIPTGIVRVGGTKNQKNGRYKIRLTFDELRSLKSKEIIELSKAIRKVLIEKPDTLSLNYHDLIVKPKAPDLYVKKTDEDTTRVVTCVQKIFNEGETIGSRHVKMLRMASAYRRAGVPISGVMSLMQQWAKSMAESEVLDIVKSVFDKGYRFSCQDKLMSQYCDTKCIFFRNKNYTPEIIDSGSLEKSYVKFINTDFTDKSFDLADIYKLDKPFRFYPGEFVVVEGDTGVNKSAWVQNLAVDIPLATLYLSLEMHQHLTYRRFIQIAHNMSRDEVEEYYRNNTNRLSNALKHIMVTTTAPELDSISKMVAECNPRILVIDVIDGLTVKGMDMESKLGVIGDGLKKLAQQLDIIIIGIHHISKLASRQGQLDVHSGKGSSTIEQKADKVIAIEGSQSTVHRIVRSLKARDEQPFQVSLKLDPVTFRLSQVS